MWIVVEELSWLIDGFVESLQGRPSQQSSPEHD